MTDALLAIDRALDGLCPCGAEPAPRSAYCGDDCTPTHRSVHTTSDTDGTQMRWRPDLVTAQDDTDLTPVDAARPGYTGRHNPSVYRRPDGRFHFRLDDGHRYVGCDVDAPADDRGVFTSDAMMSIHEAWQRLERELGNSRHLEPDTGLWPHDMGSFARDFIDQYVRSQLSTSQGQRTYGWRRLCVHCGERAVPRAGRRPAPMPPIWAIDDAGAPFASIDIEDCHLCGTCGVQFPGPPLQVYRTEGDLAYQMRLEVGDHVISARRDLRYANRLAEGARAFCPELDDLERQVLDEYARLHPDRPEVIDWVRARNAYESRLMGARLRYAQSHRIAASVIDPRGFLRNLTVT